MHVLIDLYLSLLLFNSAITAVQAPQSPEAHPSFVPVNFLLVLNKLNSSKVKQVKVHDNVDQSHLFQNELQHHL